MKGRIAGADIFTEQCNVTPTSQEHCSLLQQWRCHAVIEDCMIIFAAYSHRGTDFQSFSVCGRAPKIATSRGWDLDPI